MRFKVDNKISKEERVVKVKSIDVEFSFYFVPILALHVLFKE